MNMAKSMATGLMVLAALAVSQPTLAQTTTTTATTADSPMIGLELNKLESIEGGCRAYVVFRNPTEVEYDAFNLELLVFGTGGVIEKRLAVPVSPLRANKTTVNLFDMTSVSCDDVGEVLLNGFFECTSGGQAVEACVDRVELTSKAKARFFK